MVAVGQTYYNMIATLLKLGACPEIMDKDGDKADSYINGNSPRIESMLKAKH